MAIASDSLAVVATSSMSVGAVVTVPVTTNLQASSGMSVTGFKTIPSTLSMAVVAAMIHFGDVFEQIRIYDNVKAVLFPSRVSANVFESASIVQIFE